MTPSSSAPARADRRRLTPGARRSPGAAAGKGSELPRDGSTLDVDKVIRQGIFKSKEHWLDKNGRTFEPEEYFNLGGKTKWYGAALARFEPHEFEAEPAHQCLPWPIAYRELLPYYEQAETLLGVHRFEPEPDLRAIVGKLARNGAGWSARPLTLALDSQHRRTSRGSRALRRFRLGQEPESRRPARSAGASSASAQPDHTDRAGRSRFRRRSRSARATDWRSYRGGQRVPGRGGVAGGRGIALATAVAGLSSRQRFGRAAAVRGCGGAQLQIPPAQRCAGVFRDAQDRSAAKNSAAVERAATAQQHPAAWASTASCSVP
jgi:choline dehydrogenase-like flavoprotein